MEQQINYYSVIGVASDASQDEIAGAYRSLVRVHHPDLSPNKSDATKRLVAINIAYSVLRNPARRLEYDQRLHRQEARVVHAPPPQPPGYRDTAVSKSPNDQSSRHHYAAGSVFPNANRSMPDDFRGVDDYETLTSAEEAFVRGHYLAARDLCERHLRQHPDSRRALETIGDVCAHECKVDEAIIAYRAALKLRPTDSRLQTKIDCLNASVRLQKPHDSRLDDVIYDHSRTGGQPHGVIYQSPGIFSKMWSTVLSWLG